MSIHINKILHNSLSEESGLKPDNQIISINGNIINDFLDLQFYSADKFLKFLIQNQKGEKKEILIIQDWEKALGIEPISDKCITCINECIFCFVDQMKPNFRKTLYIKDDDYRLSFVFGNYITLTNISETQLNRIINQKLSPLYISVQTTNPSLHKKMLRYKMEFNILNQLKILTKKGIKLHTQIVILPGWNDGNELHRTLKDLDSLGSSVLSIGIVPVGLTKFRKSLLQLKTVTSAQAFKLLKLAEKYPRTFCSDEIYLLAEKKIPEEDFYEDFLQLENGIGMIRLFLENWKDNKEDFITEIRELEHNFVFITGKLAYNHINLIANEINSTLKNKIRVVEISNNFFGETVTVTGLLSAEDIMSQINLKPHEIAVVSSNIFNQDGFTLDDISTKTLKNKLNGKLLIIDEEFSDWEFV